MFVKVLSSPGNVTGDKSDINYMDIGELVLGLGLVKMENCGFINFNLDEKTVAKCLYLYR